MLLKWEKQTNFLHDFDEEGRVFDSKKRFSIGADQGGSKLIGFMQRNERMKKLVLTFAVAMMLVAFLAACGGVPTSPAPTLTPGPTPTVVPTPGVVSASTVPLTDSRFAKLIWTDVPDNSRRVGGKPLEYTMEKLRLTVEFQSETTIYWSLYDPDWKSNLALGVKNASSDSKSVQSGQADGLFSWNPTALTYDEKNAIVQNLYGSKWALAFRGVKHDGKIVWQTAFVPDWIK